MVVKKEDLGWCSYVLIKEMEGEPTDCCVRIIDADGIGVWSDFENNICVKEPLFKYKLATCQQYVHVVMSDSGFTLKHLRAKKWEIVRENGEVLEKGGLL